VQLLNWAMRNAPGQRDRAWLVGMVNMLRYSPPFCPRCFVDAGLGAYVIENRSAFRLRPTGSSFTFSEEVGFGAYLDAERRVELRIGYAHFSNANVNRPNPGYDFFHVRAGLRF
jgi:lipid A 3-O-deacylase